MVTEFNTGEYGYYDVISWMNYIRSMNNYPDAMLALLNGIVDAEKDASPYATTSVFKPLYGEESADIRLNQLYIRTYAIMSRLFVYSRRYGEIVRAKDALLNLVNSTLIGKHREV